MSETPVNQPASSSTPSPNGEKAAEMFQKVKSALLKLPLAEKLIFGGGVAYLLGSFIPLYTTKSMSFYGYSSPSVSVNMWDMSALYVVLTLVVVLIALALPFLHTLAPTFKLPLPKALLYLVTGVVGVLVPLVRWLSIDGKGYLNLGVGFFVLLVGAALIVAGGVQSGGFAMAKDMAKKARQAPPPAAPPAA